MISINELKELAQNYSVLYVEDELRVRKSTTHYLQSFFAKVDSVTNGQEGLEYYKKNSYDIVITDINMPKLNGLQMAQMIREIDENQEILIVSAYAESDFFIDSIRIGVSGYIIKPIDFRQINEVLYRILNKLTKFRENILYKENLEALVEEKTIEQKESYEQIISSLVTMLENRDTYTAGHSQRVANYSRLIAEEMGYDEKDCSLIYRAGILHDIGKIATPDAVLLKPGKLDSVEYKLIQEHVTMGVNMLKKISMYHQFIDIIAAHHEHYDGSGYPNKLKEDEIPPLAHIMIVCDAFDAMTTNRIYKESKTVSEALKELNELSGIHFHPDVVQAAQKVLSHVDIEKEISQLPVSKLEEERFVYFYRDSVSDLYNQNYFDLVLSKDIEKKKYQKLTIFHIENFADYNKMHGWSKGDIFLRKFADSLKELFHNRLIFRVHGDYFVVIYESSFKVDANVIVNDALLVKNHIELSTNEFDIEENSIRDMSSLEKIITT